LPSPGAVSGGGVRIARGRMEDGVLFEPGRVVVWLVTKLVTVRGELS
jgi:hypothetical protein